jgi:hypothetical protein
MELKEVTAVKINAMLRNNFLQSELEYLREQPLFVATKANVRSGRDLHYIFDLAEVLLEEWNEVTPPARQFRQGSEAVAQCVSLQTEAVVS